MDRSEFPNSSYLALLFRTSFPTCQYIPACADVGVQNILGTVLFPADATCPAAAIYTTTDLSSPATWHLLNSCIWTQQQHGKPVMPRKVFVTGNH